MAFENVIKVQLTCANIAYTLSCLSECNITITNMEYISDLTIQFEVNKAHSGNLQKLSERHGWGMRIIRQRGIGHVCKTMIARPVLVVFFAWIIVLSMLLPTRILFIDIKGNSDYSDQAIMEVVRACGLRFGASRRLVRSEEIKNEIIEKMPQLHWVGINTVGCVAVVTVEEKETPDAGEGDLYPVTSIVAAQDGIITSCTVESGTALCTVGQAVKRGQVLVSGYMDCGIKVQATTAKAEITANTLRQIDAITPAQRLKRTDDGKEIKKISLQIGKKLINFSQGSGICGGSCVKIYATKYLTLPGGRKLPVAWITEYHQHDPDNQELTHSTLPESTMTKMARAYLESKMIAGRIIHEETVFLAAETSCCLVGTYSCTESIGYVVHERGIENYG